MNKSRTKATAEEIKEIQDLYRNAQATPVIAISGAHAQTGGMSGDAYRMFSKRMDEIATAHGLAPQAGEWGLDADGHFLSEHPIVEETPVG